MISSGQPTEKASIHRLEPGLHILANGNINDFETVRIRRARRLLQYAPYTEWQRCLSLLQQVCRDHESGVKDRETICMHRDHERYGTVSSTILALTLRLLAVCITMPQGSPVLSRMRTTPSS
jgi:hypothetical protein